MKKYKNIFVAFLIVIGIMVSANITAFATEVETPIDGNVTCNISFQITDETDGYSGSIIAYMEDVDSPSEESYVFTSANSWGTGRVVNYSVTNNTTYEVRFEGLLADYQMVNADGTPITSFVAVDGLSLEWKIVYTGADVANNAVDNTTETTVGNTMENETNTTSTGDSAVSKNEAESLFNAFLDAMNSAETESGGSFLTSWGVVYGSNVDSVQWYVDYARGTAEDFEAMTTFNKFVYIESYLRMASYANAGTYSTYFASEDVFFSNTGGGCNTIISLMSNYPDIVESYTNLMKYQYAYISENGVPYDFITGANYLELTGKTEVPVSEGETFTEEEAEQVAELLDDMEEEQVTDTKEDEVGLWGAVIQRLKNNAISLVILVILCASVGVLAYKRKQNNIDDDNDK